MFNPLRTLLPLLLAALLSPGVQAGSDQRIAKALAAPTRSADDRERDSRDQPQAVLALAGFDKGQVIADIFGGGGYYSEILSRVVGRKGEVLLVNNAPYDAYARKELAPRLDKQRLANVHYSIVANEKMQLGSARLDGALIVMSFHDLYYADPENNWPAIDTRQFIEQIVTALKPGGVLLIVDHAAKAGTGASEAQRLHRIEESFVTSELKARGLMYTGSITALRNPGDDHSLGVFDPAIRGKTDRFVHLYRKP